MGKYLPAKPCQIRGVRWPDFNILIPPRNQVIDFRTKPNVVQEIEYAMIESFRINEGVSLRKGAGG